MCIRVVDDDGDIKEEFLEFGQWKWIDRKSTAEEILYTLQKVDLSVNNCWGQMYDGTANMSSEAAGIQSIIKNNSIKKSFNSIYFILIYYYFVSFQLTTVVMITQVLYKMVSKLFIRL